MFLPIPTPDFNFVIVFFTMMTLSVKIKILWWIENSPYLCWIFK